MCASCFSAAEAVIINATGGLVLAKGSLDRVGDVFAGRHPALRRQSTWDANADFVSQLGLDPAAVLGARPEVPAAMSTPAWTELGAALA